MADVKTAQPQKPQAQEDPDLSGEAAELLRDILINKPLYAKVHISDIQSERMEELLNFQAVLEFDLYCASCKQVTPWKIAEYKVQVIGGGSVGRYRGSPPPLKVHVVKAVCLRKQHFYIYVLHFDKMVLQKIGQKPSMADIAFGQLKGLGTVDPQDRAEMGRALGLFAHDTPLGAFVYLRRVFERMIGRAHESYTAENGGPIPGWADLRMGQRVTALGPSLPKEVSQNAGVFGLLSKGIHELSDGQAETLFPLVKAVIFQMLGDEQRQREAAIARDETNRALQTAIAQQNSSNST